MKILYEWSWNRLSLWKNTRDSDGCGGSSRIFTLWPPWVYSGIKNRILYGPDPLEECAKWLKLNNHWNDEDFFRAVCWWYANSSKPGTMVKLNPWLFL